MENALMIFLLRNSSFIYFIFSNNKKVENFPRFFSNSLDSLIIQFRFHLYRLLRIVDYSMNILRKSIEIPIAQLFSDDCGYFQDDDWIYVLPPSIRRNLRTHNDVVIVDDDDEKYKTYKTFQKNKHPSNGEQYSRLCDEEVSQWNFN